MTRPNSTILSLVVGALGTLLVLAFGLLSLESLSPTPAVEVLATLPTARAPVLSRVVATQQATPAEATQAIESPAPLVDEDESEAASPSPADEVATREVDEQLAAEIVQLNTLLRSSAGDRKRAAQLLLAAALRLDEDVTGQLDEANDEANDEASDEASDELELHADREEASSDHTIEVASGRLRRLGRGDSLRGLLPGARLIVFDRRTLEALIQASALMSPEEAERWEHLNSALESMTGHSLERGQTWSQWWATAAVARGR